MKKVAIIMGSDSDLPVVSKAADTLKQFGVPFELHIFPKGPHGLALSNDLTGANVKPVPHCECWVELAVRWLRDFFG